MLTDGIRVLEKEKASRMTSAFDVSSRIELSFRERGKWDHI